MMLDNSSFNKLKLLYKLSDLLWFIEKHALIDAQSAGDTHCVKMLQDLQKDFQRHVGTLQKSVCMISQ